VNKLNPIAIYLPNKVKSKEAGATEDDANAAYKSHEGELASVTNLDW
jgi:hypothetical protein